MSRILVIDEDPGNRLIMKSRLIAERHEVALAEGGAHGLVDARNAAYDLCLVAAEMTKGIDGFEVCRRLKSMPETSALPVVLFNPSSAAHEATERAYQAGCDSYVTRAELPALDHVVRVLVRQRQQVLELSEQTRALSEHNRKLHEERVPHPDAESHSKDAGDQTGALRELACSRPDGLLIVDGEGTVRHADRGAGEILGPRIIGRHLGSLAPASRLEAFVRDAHSESREGFRFDLVGRKGASRTFQAALVPIVPVPGEHDPGLCVVLLYDAAKRKLAADLLRVQAPGIAQAELGALREAARQTYRPAAWIGTSASAVELRHKLAQASQLCEPVLILGPPGSGKARLARTLHYSGAHTGPFVQVRCSALSADNLDLELFGWTRDAAAAAHGERPGLFQQAHDGTLYLDGVRELSQEIQAKVLRFLGDGTLCRRGARRVERADVRVIASNEAPLLEAVEEGRFSKDLYAMFAGTLFSLPPLSARPEDIEPLASHFVASYGSPRDIRGITNDAILLLKQHAWSGNVAELERCIEQACARATTAILCANDLPRALRQRTDGDVEHELVPVRAPDTAPVQGTHSVAEPVREVELPRAEPRPREVHEWDITEKSPLSFAFYEKQLLLRALDESAGDKIAAAKKLDVGKSTLYRKLKRYGIR